MPRVRMITSVADLRHSYDSGQEYDVPGSQAQEWLAAGLAELVKAEAPLTPERRRAARIETRRR